MFAIPNFNAQCFVNGEAASGVLTIAISSCLTGAAVRYDGADKYLRILSTWAAAPIRLLPICPEVGAGLGVPRPPVELIAAEHGLPRARGRDLKSLDVTAALTQFALDSIGQLQREPALCGYVWKSRSPSCGRGSTPLYGEDGMQIGLTSGIQARHIAATLPGLVGIEDSQLQNEVAATRFVLQCRLVFDARLTRARDPGQLPAWHRHYAFLHDLLGSAAGVELQRLADGSDWEGYLVVLNRACENIEAERLLGLFVIAAGAS